MPEEHTRGEVLTLTDLRTRTSEIKDRLMAGETFYLRHYTTIFATITPLVTPAAPPKESRMTQPQTPRPVTAVFYNQAGGSCKTSLVRDVAYDAVQRGLRVLAIDADPQGSLTRWLGGYEIKNDRGQALGMRPDRTVYDVITGRVDELPEPLTLHGIDLIPGNTTVEGAAVLLAMRGNEHMIRLRQAIDGLSDRYDLVLIDTPPADNHLVTTCMVAADVVFTPVSASKGLDRVDTIMQAMRSARAYNQELRFGGFIPAAMHLRRDSQSDEYKAGHYQEVLDMLRTTYSTVGPTFEVIKARPALFNDAAAAMMPVAVFKPRHEVVMEIQAVADQIYAALGFVPAEPEAAQMESASAPQAVAQ